MRSWFPGLLAGALILAFIFCSIVSGAIASRVMDEQKTLANIMANREPSLFTSWDDESARGPDMKFAAFNVADSNPASKDKKTDEARPIDAFQLVGTLPAIGAWINVDSATSLVLRSQDFNGYVLEKIEKGSVLFNRDGETFPLYLTLSGGGPPPPAPPQVASQAQPPDQGNSQLTQAILNGEDGMIARELISKIIADPMVELAKVRLVPGESGMQVRNLRSDSLLAQAGIKQGDILTGVNGLPINNMPDMINVFKSLMTFTRFDLSLTREQNPGKFGYVVR
jgi:type II secretory pathway component PulC